MDKHEHFVVRVASSRRRAALVPALAMVIALTAGCGGASTEPTIVNVPADKVPPKKENPVPTSRKHGPKYGVSPQIDLSSQKG